ncbi:hypothetical protein [Dactylosporangium sp. CA-233914]|uniref:hypothetical protein n=1 Tax=Dactylosporangium sp. CA-233914 TaxID=3239934 RepID=UPI003D8B3727
MSVRLVRAAAAVLVAATAAVAVPAPAAAAGTAGYCPDATGVTVVVDFHELGGGVVIRCAPGAQGSGLTVLQNAGFTVAGTNRWGLAFICRIEGKPTAATEPCVDTPPATAYWSYWYAANGGSWTYSDRGVKNRTPPQGSFDGWSFSKNHTGGTAPKPGAAPSRPAPPTPPPATGQPAPGAARTTAAAPGTTAPTPSTAPASTSAPAAADAAGSPVPNPSATASDEPSTTWMPSSTAPTADVEATRTASGVPIGTLAGVAVLVVLAAAAGVVAWRRRQARDS